MREGAGGVSNAGRDAAGVGTGGRGIGGRMRGEGGGAGRGSRRGGGAASRRRAGRWVVVACSRSARWLSPDVFRWPPEPPPGPREGRKAPRGLRAQPQGAMAQEIRLPPSPCTARLARPPCAAQSADCGGLKICRLRRPENLQTAAA